MDVRTAKLSQAIDSYLQNGDHIPEGLSQHLSETKDMLSAPIYSEESPGERAAREVSEATMPEGLADEYLKAADDSNVGVFSNISETTIT